MPRPHIAMRKIRHVLRLALGEQMSYREVGRATALPHTTVADYVRRARAAGLGWPLPERMDDDAIERVLFSRPEAPPGAKAVPDWATVHLERVDFSLSISSSSPAASRPSDARPFSTRRSFHT